MIVAAWVPLVVMAVLSYLMRSKDTDARHEADGTVVLEYGRPWRLLGIYVGAVWTAIFTYMFITVPPKPDDVPFVLLLIGIATGTLVPYVIMVYGEWYRLTESGLSKRSAWTRRERSAAWSDVQSVSYNGAMGWFVFKTPAGTIRVSRFVKGITDLRDALEKRVPAACWTSAKRELDLAAKLIART